MRQRNLLVLVLFLMLGCRDKVICPAFQSTYILDDSVRATYYSYLWKLDEAERTKYLAVNQPKPTPDSTGGPLTASASVDYFAYVEQYIVPPREVNKNKYGMVKYEPYWLKNYHQRTAPMENVLTPPPVELPKPIEEGEIVTADFKDSLMIDTSMAVVKLQVQVDDSLAVDSLYDDLPLIAQLPPPPPQKVPVFLYNYDPDDEMLNVEQQYYNKHFGQYLYRMRDPQPPVTEVPADTTVQQGGGLKSIFRKKEPKEDPAVTEPPIEDPGTGG